MSSIVLEKLNRISDPQNEKQMRAAIEQIRRILDQIEKELKNLDDNKQDK